jgi:transposase-like protein
MSKKRRQYSPADKFKVALEVAKGTKTLAEIASHSGIHPNQISQWKGHLLNEGANLFRRNRDPAQHEIEKREATLDLIGINKKRGLPAHCSAVNPPSSLEASPSAS